MSLRNAFRRRVLTGSPSASDGSSGPRHSRLARRLSGIEWALWTVVVLAMSADVASTHVGRQIGLVELNPVARDVLRVGGVPGLLAMKGAVVGVGVSLRAALPNGYTAVVPLALAVPTVPAVVSNVTVIAITVT